MYRRKLFTGTVVLMILVQCVVDASNVEFSGSCSEPRWFPIFDNLLGISAA